jgi:hypothetical protein
VSVQSPSCTRAVVLRFSPEVSSVWVKAVPRVKVAIEAWFVDQEEPKLE